MQIQTVSSKSTACSGINAGSVVLMGGGGGGATLKRKTVMMTTTKNNSKSILHYHLSVETSGNVILRIKYHMPY
jgi:hypothetical protein